MKTEHRKWNALLPSLLLMTLAIVVTATISAADTKVGKKNAVARVNSTFISKEDYQRQFSIARQQLLRRGVPLDEAGMKRLGDEVLEDLIDNELLFQESRKRGYDAEDQEIDEQFERVLAQFPDEQAFESALEEVHYTESTFKSAIERRIVLMKLIDNDIVPGVTVSEDESRQYYESNPEYFVQPKQVRASHILIVVEDQNNDQQKREALEKIKNIQQKLKDGEDFAALAREYSEGPSSAQGGDLGFFQRGQTVRPFEEAAFAMEAGEVSDIVETTFGYHLIEVTDMRAEVTIPYEYAKNSIDQYLEQNKVMVEIEVLVNDLREGAEIERYPENV